MAGPFMQGLPFTPAFGLVMDGPENSWLWNFMATLNAVEVRLLAILLKEEPKYKKVRPGC